MFSITEINHLLPFILKPDNIARLDLLPDGRRQVVIGNRKAYPLEKSFVRCDTVEAVAVAIESMVTQGAGPWQAATCGLALAAHEAAGFAHDAQMAHIVRAKERLVATRPTNTALARRLELAIEAITSVWQAGGDLEAAVLTWLTDKRTEIYRDYAARGRHGAALVADGDGIITMCFAEAAFILAMGFAQEAGKRIHVYVPETRPYLQGAKLTAPALHEIGIPTTLIGDNMAAYLFSSGKVQKYFTAADLITLDGHVVNKIGTLQHAVVAKYYGIPYYPFAWGVDRTKPDRDSIEIELRDPAEIKMIKGVATTDPSIDALYPAFDVTPPDLVTGIITKHGVVPPNRFGDV